MSDTGTAVEHTMGAANGLGRKAHGLPIWGWALIVVGGGMLVYYLWSKSSGGMASGSSLGLGAVSTAAPAPAAMSSGSAYSTNQAWQAAGISEFGSGTNTPLSVSAALSNLLNGNPLSSQDQGIVNQVIGGIGAPPQSAPPPILAVPAVPAPTVKGYLKAPNNPNIYQLTSDGLLHYANAGVWSRIDPTMQYSTVDNLGSYTMGADATVPGQ